MRVTVGKERYEEVGLGLLALRELFSLNNRNSRSHESLRLKNTYKLEPIESAERERERTDKQTKSKSINRWNLSTYRFFLVRPFSLLFLCYLVRVSFSIAIAIRTLLLISFRFGGFRFNGRRRAGFLEP